MRVLYAPGLLHTIGVGLQPKVYLETLNTVLVSKLQVHLLQVEETTTSCVEF